MLGLAAYMDESGHSEDPNCRFVGIGGLCAPAKAWSTLEERWQTVLDDQCGVPWFHMKDFAAKQGVYEGWEEPRRRKLLGALVEAISLSKARAFGAVVSLDAYDYIAKAIPQVEDFFVEPYYLCFQDVTRAAALQAMEYSWPFAEGVEQVAMVYAKQEQYGAIQSKSGASREQNG